MIINTELENSAVVVMKDGNKFDVNIVGENLETLQTYLRSGRVALSLLDFANKDDSVVNELMLDKTKLYVRLPDGSIRAITGQADDDLRFLIDNLVEVGVNEVKPSTNVKFFFKTSAYEEPNDLREAINSPNAKKYVLYVDEKPTPDSVPVRSLVVPYMDIDHIEVPVIDENGNLTGTFINLTQHINNIYNELYTFIEEVRESTKDLARDKEDRQYENGVNLIRLQDISFNRINNFKDGISVYRLRNDNSGSNGWQNVLNTMGVRVGAEALLTITTSPIRDREGEIIVGDSTTGGLYLHIEPVDGLRESNGNRYRTVQGCVRRGDSATLIEWIYNTPHLSQDDRIVYGDKFNRGATNISSVKQINRSGFYYYNNSNPATDDSPIDYAVSGTNSNGRRETQGLVFATVAKPTSNAEIAVVAMTFISSTSGYTYHTSRPMHLTIVKRNANDIDWDVTAVTQVPTWTKMLDASFISDLIKPGDTARTASYLDTRDLNSVIAEGEYYQDTNAKATTGRHYPIEHAGSLRVTKAAGIIQTYTTYGTNSEIYVRGYYSGVWGSWRRYMADGGTYNTVKMSDWFRSIGASGWCNETYGGQIYQNSTADIKINKTLNPLAGIHMPNDVKIEWSRNTDGFSIGFHNTGDNADSYAYFETWDNGDEYFVWQHRVTGSGEVRRWMHLNGSELYEHGRRVISEGHGKTFSTVLMNNWFRSVGNSGWYSETHGGGIYMTDSTWVKVYNNKKFRVENNASDSITTTGGVSCANITLSGVLITVEV